MPIRVWRTSWCMLKVVLGLVLEVQQSTRTVVRGDVPRRFQVVASLSFTGAARDPDCAAPRRGWAPTPAHSARLALPLPYSFPLPTALGSGQRAAILPPVLAR